MDREQVVALLENGTHIGGLGNYEPRWHTDQSYRERPATGAVFHDSGHLGR